MSHEERADSVKVFQSDGRNSPSVMLLSLKVSSQISSLFTDFSPFRPVESD